MHSGSPDKIRVSRFILFLLLITVLLPACTILKEEQKGKPFIVKNSIEVKGGKFSKDELIALKSRLNTQLEDSAQVNVVDKLFFWHIYKKPAAFDTVYASRSAKNMQSSMHHLGYYRAEADFRTDTVKQTKPQQVKVYYTVQTGKPTLIDTVTYRLRNDSLQRLTMQNLDKGLLKEGQPVTKAAVLGEISRLVDLYRNNGYYKFTSEELKVQGDTSLEALTNISDDPFEQLQQLVLAQQKKDSPKIKLAVVLNPPADSNRLRQYHIRKIYILPDYRPGDTLKMPGFEERVLERRLGYIIRFRNKRFRTGFLLRNLFIKPGDMYNQVDYYKTLNSFSRIGAWQSVNIEIMEVKDSVGKIDMVVQLIPAGQYVFEASLEASYSANSNTNSVTTVNAGNLLGTSASLSFTNRNLGKEGIKWTSSVRAGVEFNLKPDRNDRKNLINSNELGLSNTFIIPRFLFPFKKLNGNPKYSQPQTFVNLNTSLINRINLFNLQSANLGYGFTWHTRRNGEFTFKLLNVEFAKLYNQTDSFTKTLEQNPFLKYSFNTALVAGNLNASYSISRTNPKFANRQYSFKSNLEESGLVCQAFNLFEKYIRKFIKLDFEYSHSRSRPKSALIFRSFVGAGVPLFKDTSLPFFKQYFGGGSNSMRGWPVRGIGRGSQPLAPYATSRFNDRTGDLQFETNLEYRYNIAQIIPNTMLLKGALFIDAGNVWNLRNSKTSGTDSAQFQFKNFWRDLGINAGAGFRLDFNYFVIRLDLGFRFKRPEMAYVKNGWKIPSLSFNDVFQKLFAKGENDEYRKWRYENFNFTIGINYPF